MKHYVLVEVPDVPEWDAGMLACTIAEMMMETTELTECWVASSDVTPIEKMIERLQSIRTGPGQHKVQ